MDDMCVFSSKLDIAKNELGFYSSYMIAIESSIIARIHGPIYGSYYLI